MDLADTEQTIYFLQDIFMALRLQGCLFEIKIGAFHLTHLQINGAQGVQELQPADRKRLTAIYIERLKRVG